MSYNIDLGDFDEEILRSELQRRKEMRAMGRCDYCGRLPSDKPCRYPLRHRKPDPAKQEETP